MSDFIASFRSFFSTYLGWVDFNRLSISIIDIIEIIIIGIVIYNILVWIKKTKAWTLLKGLLVILVFILIAALTQMTTILWLSGKVVNIGIIAIVIIFQPELRHALEQLGRKNVLSTWLGLRINRDSEDGFDMRSINEVCTAVFEMGKNKTGALIVIERETPLTEYIDTGIQVDSVITNQLLINIFEHNTPLHDGAVIIRGNRLTAATCYLPLSQNSDLSKSLGTRHRAAVGLSEVSDAITIVVSEETGYVSMATEDIFLRNIEPDKLKSQLINACRLEVESISFSEKLRRRLTNDK